MKAATRKFSNKNKAHTYINVGNIKRVIYTQENNETKTNTYKYGEFTVIEEYTENGKTFNEILEDYFKAMINKEFN